MAKRICKVDGTVYDYCPNCDKYQNEPKWKVSFCCENCRSVFNTLVDNSVGKLTKKQTRNALSKLDLSKMETFTPAIQRQINSIMTKPKVISEDIEM
jgi:hypothetical protein